MLFVSCSGDITPQTTGERVLSVTMMAFGGFLYAFIIGSFGSMVDQIHHDVAGFDMKMRSISALLKVCRYLEKQRVFNFTIFVT